jgi:nucleoid DNA-binding protein
MKPIEIVEKIKAENPEVLGKMNDKVAARIVRLALAEVARQVTDADEGVVKVVGLGHFRVKHIEKEVDGAKVATKRIFFVAAKPVDEATIQARKAKLAESQSAS